MTSFLKPDHEKLNDLQKVSYVVLFQDKKPVCAVPAFQNTGLLPTGFQAKKASKSINLPKCNPEDIAKVSATIPHMHVMKDEEDSYQLALGPLTPLSIAGFCVASGVVGGAIASLVEFITNKIRYYSSTSDDILYDLGLTGIGISFVGAVSKSSTMTAGGVTLAVMGFCGGAGASFVLGFLDELDELKKSKE